MSNEMSSYLSSCHCTAIKFRFTLPDNKSLESGEYKVSRCDCSICTIAGTLMVYPHVRDVDFLSGWDETNRGVYTFGPTPIIEHYFCKVCGTRMGAKYTGPLSKGQDENIAINVRTVRNIDLKSLTYYDRELRGGQPEDKELENLESKGWIYDDTRFPSCPWVYKGPDKLQN